MRFVIVTGMSGAGKSQAIDCLEDIGFYCVDNMPPKLLPSFAEVLVQSKGHFDQVALVMDMRGGDLFNDLSENLEILQQKGYEFEILFLDAEDDVIIHRYKESRRAHPMAVDIGIEDALKLEREHLAPIKTRATYLLDTSHMLPKELKAQIQSIFNVGGASHRLSISVLSFGFKYGIPLEADMVFDVRFLPNPFYIEDLKPKTGLDPEVSGYVMQFPQSQEFYQMLVNMFDFLLGYFIEEGKSQLTIAIGCTGGKHRSVTFAEAIGKYLIEKGERAVIRHRDIEKDRV